MPALEHNSGNTRRRISDKCERQLKAIEKLEGHKQYLIIQQRSETNVHMIFHEHGRKKVTTCSCSHMSLTQNSLPGPS